MAMQQDWQRMSKEMWSNKDIVDKNLRIREQSKCLSKFVSKITVWFCEYKV